MKKFLLIILVVSILTVYTVYKRNQPVISNITVSFADSLYIPTSLTQEEEFNLVDIQDLPTNLFVELRYASTDNFAGKEFYPKIAKAYLREGTAEKLLNANEELYKLGYRIKVFDAYRPYRYQKLLREAAHDINPKTEGYIADPKYGSHHNRGASVDITLTDLEGRELPMPTGYDHFGKEASINYTGCTEEEKKNRELLGKVMENNGFRRINSEWWHFDDTDYLDYALLNVDFIDLYK